MVSFESDGDWVVLAGCDGHGQLAGIAAKLLSAVVVVMGFSQG